MTNIELKTTTATVERNAPYNTEATTVSTEATVSQYSHILPTAREFLFVNREDHEGLLPLMVLGNGNTCKVPTGNDPKADEVPEWALNDQIMGADLSERRDFYVETIGDEAYREMFDTDVINFHDITLNAWDHEENEVVLGADREWRMENLATTLGLDTSIEAWDEKQGHDVIEAAFDQQDATNPPSEEILEGVHETLFGEVPEAKRMTGSK